MPNGASPGSASTTTSRSQGFFYSVPHALIREQVDTRATARTIEVFHRGNASPRTPAATAVRGTAP